MNPPSGPSKKGKITIKNIRQHQMDPNYAENTWNLLKNAIHEIHRQNASGLSFEELYRNAYNMVLHKYGDLLYRGLREVVHEHLQSVALQVAHSNDQEFLPQLQVAWNCHKMSMMMIRDILMYMDRVYVMANSVRTVYDLGLYYFLEDVARCPEIKGRLLESVLGLVENERNGELVDTSLLKTITSMWIDVGVNNQNVYEEDFEAHFLAASSRFYMIEAQTFIAQCSCPEYLLKVEQRLKEEETRVATYLARSSEPKIRAVVERELIATQIQTLLEMEGTGLIPLLKASDKGADLARLYRLFSRVEHGNRILCEAVAGYVKDTAKNIVTLHEADPEQYIQQLIDFRDHFNELLDASFAKDKEFAKSINQSFEYAINYNRRSPEYVSLYIDEKLQKGFQGMSEAQMHLVLRKVMEIFRFIQEKDVFEKWYKQHLARRLLLSRSISHDAEQGMISSLKCECGYQFTSKLEGMFNDMRTSADTMEQFRALVASGKIAVPSGIDLSVQVLTTGFWPTQTAGECVLPATVEGCCSVFRDFYLSTRAGRVLTWQTNMGTADILATFSRRRHLLSVSTHQMAILLAFHGVPARTFSELAHVTGIASTDLKRNLLLLARVKLLNKEPRTKKFEDSDVFSFNMDFQTKYHRVKIMGTNLPKADTQQRELTTHKVEEDRKHHIEAAIVRIMKARKQMDHVSLINETTRQLQSRFRPNPLIIKKRIESLIEREYLQRIPDDWKTYRYIA